MNRAFTLIELLVVVLIIGILSAIALPQYEKAVRKSRVAEAKVLLKAVGDAGEVYKLANPNWHLQSLDIEDFDVSVPTETKNWTIYLDECIEDGCVYTATPKFESGYGVSYADSKYDNCTDNLCKSFYCVPNDCADAQHIALCKALGGAPPPSQSSCAYKLP